MQQRLRPKLNICTSLAGLQRDLPRFYPVSWKLLACPNQLWSQPTSLDQWYPGTSRTTYSANAYSARPAATTINCRPSTVNDIGADLVVPPSGTRQSSRPVSASKAKKTSPDA